MPTATQKNRSLGIETPLGADKLLLTAFQGREAMSSLFGFQLQMLSNDATIKPQDIVGKRVSFWVELADESKRYFDGFVTSFAFRGTGDRFSLYLADVAPNLWFLTQRSDCRIFQDKAVPDILREVFDKAGLTESDLRVNGNHPKRTYCVQYRETDFAFVSRLMEEEGIFYYFRHEKGKHTLVVADDKSAYAECDDGDVQLLSNLSQPESTDPILRWDHGYRFRAGKWSTSDYNFETPTHPLGVNTSTLISLDGNTKYEYYDYPGEYTVKPDGEALVRLRMEEIETGHEIVQGQSECRTFSPGHRFKMARHHAKAEAGKKYVLTAVEHEATLGGAYVTGGSAVEQSYRNSFTCIPDSVTFRPERNTARPKVFGVQTAVVVGPRGEEIYTDEYGRVKVQFHWDRVGKKDEKSSCWIRCAQSMAGRGWGAMFLPRIGQEVVVSYEEGDPDRPLVTGVLYNADQMPPYSLPDERTKTCLKTNSSKGGDGFNEIRFEDKAESEQLFVHAQKDMDTHVLNDFHEWVERDRHLVVDRHEFEKIGENSHLSVGGNWNQEVGQTVSLKAAEHHEKLDLQYALEAGQSVHIKAGMSLVIEAGAQLSLKVGGNFVDLSPAGVAINGMPLAMINSGGAAGTGPGANPKPPEEAKKASVDPDIAKSGKTSAP
jgi:type VI secretion system secreted protein VgrG